jgi:hypothetical protein
MHIFVIAKTEQQNNVSVADSVYVKETTTDFL